MLTLFPVVLEWPGSPVTSLGTSNSKLHTVCAELWLHSAPLTPAPLMQQWMGSTPGQEAV